MKILNILLKLEFVKCLQLLKEEVLDVAAGSMGEGSRLLEYKDSHHSDHPDDHHDHVRNVDHLTHLLFSHNQRDNTILVSFKAYQQDFNLALHENKDFIMQGAVLEVQSDSSHSGLWTTQLPTSHVYKGGLTDSMGRDVEGSFARIVVHEHALDDLHFDGILFAPSIGMMHVKHLADYGMSSTRPLTLPCRDCEPW